MPPTLATEVAQPARVATVVEETDREEEIRGHDVTGVCPEDLPRQWLESPKLATPIENLWNGQAA